MGNNLSASVSTELLRSTVQRTSKFRGSLDLARLWRGKGLMLLIQ
uniref:Protein transport protein sec23 n=1 Tax=Rhizophora mucronata TaxID=61149 RepID=A0A2P2NIM5_RHIMU